MSEDEWIVHAFAFDGSEDLGRFLGVTMLLNRGMPLTLMALVPINVVIVYWNLVLDPALSVNNPDNPT